MTEPKPQTPSNVFLDKRRMEKRRILFFEEGLAAGHGLDVFRGSGRHTGALL